MCTISGGADSDIILDICTRLDVDKIVDYVWFDTGVEFQATKRHLDYLEKRYDITIKRYRPKKAVPLATREYGQPFISKYASEMISRLQRHNFKWEDRPFEELYSEYPKCKIALMWWCNTNKVAGKFNIERNKYLKEFMVANPPTFPISNKCCLYAKKNVSKELTKNMGYELIITGIRKAEGGIRASAYKTCFSFGDKEDNYRPIFWYTNEDKKCYEEHFNIVHSECYTKYELKRTGCACCPYGKSFEFELQVCKENEPMLYKAVSNIFKDSYEYQKSYDEFKKQCRK